MFEGIVVGCLVFVLAAGGQILLASMAALPVIGGFAGWYAGFVGPLPDGVVSNLIYGAMAVQVVVMPLALLFYGPRLVRRLNKLRRQQSA